MRASLDVLSDNRTLSKIEFHYVQAQGVISPRFSFAGTVSLMPTVKNLRIEVSLRLEYQGELIGESRPTKISVDQYGGQAQFEVITSQRLLKYVTRGLSSDQTAVQLSARIRGEGSYVLKPVQDPQADLRMRSDPEPGVATGFSFDQTGTISIDRTEWYQQVLSPTRSEQYRFLEIALPRSDRELAREWAESIQLLQEAERSFASGDDAAVFLHLRGSLDALPGAKQNICDSIKDERKKKVVDELIRSLGNYLHLGRHVSADGPSQGSFPVDHLDAAFAIDLMRTTLSHLSLQLSAELERARRDA